MWSLINYFGPYGSVKLHKNNNCFNLTIRKFADLDTKVIPFFVKYPIIGQKLLDFQDFCRVCKLMKENEHLTIEGLTKISEIKSGMNTSRSVGTVGTVVTGVTVGTVGRSV